MFPVVHLLFNSRSLVLFHYLESQRVQRISTREQRKDQNSKLNLEQSVQAKSLPQTCFSYRLQKSEKLENLKCFLWCIYSLIVGLQYYFIIQRVREFREFLQNIGTKIYCIRLRNLQSPHKELFKPIGGAHVFSFY